MFPEVEEDVDEAGTACTSFDVRRSTRSIAVAELRLEGVVAQPNHVLFAHGCDCCGPHPAHRWASADRRSVCAHPCLRERRVREPVSRDRRCTPTRVRRSRVRRPVYAKAVSRVADVRERTLQATGQRRSSAKPGAAPPARDRRAAARSARAADRGARHGHGRRRTPTAAPSTRSRPPQQHWERPDVDGDHYLDPAAGHGTFIAGLIDLVIPGLRDHRREGAVELRRGDEVAIAQPHPRPGRARSTSSTSPSVATRSSQMHVLAAAVRRATRLGTVVVASAGNDGTCRRDLPRRPPGRRRRRRHRARRSRAVHQLRPLGAGVRARRRHRQLVLHRVRRPSDRAPAGDAGPRPTSQSWARWSGTSFAAPMVAAALARHMGIVRRRTPPRPSSR